VTNGDPRKLYNEKLHHLYSSQILNKVIKSRRTRWIGHVEAWHRGKKHIF
jgi:hypothetical protein